MKWNRGTPTFGILLGILFALIGLLWMTLGFWKMLLLLFLFAAGFLIGAVDNKSQLLKDTVNRLIPEKKHTPIDLRETVIREQEKAFTSEKEAEKEE